MKSIFMSGLLSCSLASAAEGADAAKSPLAFRMEQAAAGLPQGCIVAGEMGLDGVPVFSVAGRQEPAGVAPEKVVFEIGSISKVFTGLLLAQAVLEKKVRLETTLKELMGDGVKFADEQVAGITLKQLATHTSGLPRIPEDLLAGTGAGGDVADPYAHYDRARLEASVTAVKLAHAPPSASSYSNLGVGLLGDLLARVYERSWEELVVERICQPLGMTDTSVTLNAGQKTRLAPAYAGGEEVKPWRFQALAGAAVHRGGHDAVWPGSGAAGKNADAGGD